MDDEAIMNIGEDYCESGVELSVGGEPAEGDGASMNVDADKGEAGYETEVLGDEELKEDVKEPRDNYDHYADHTFHNNVTMAGTLRTKRWIHPHGCMFHSIGELKAEYPKPVRGMWAWVGIGFPSKIWICEEDGVWKEADSNVLDKDALDTILSSYATRQWVNEQIKALLSDGDAPSVSHSKYADKAGYADVAGDLSEDSPANRRFLSRLKDDTAEGVITFLKGLVAEEVAKLDGGATFGDTIDSMLAGKGTLVTNDGRIQTDRIEVRQSLYAMEVIINRLGAQEGDTVFAESDTIESITANADGTYRIKVQEKYEGYFTAMTEGMVIRGVVNDLASGGKDYYTSWMRINAVNASANSIEVSLYPDNEVPGGRNFPPCELMRMTRWGHQTDTEKQSLFLISSTEGRIFKLSGVDRPIIDFGNYEMTLGTLPDRIHELLPIALGESGVYAKHVIAQYYWQLDHQGKVLPTVRDRGPWVAGEMYYSGDTLRPETNDYEQSDVWHLGCRWRCMVTGTTDAPDYATTAWAFIEGDPTFRVELTGGPAAIRPKSFKFTLKILATLHNEDVTEFVDDADIEWTRYSEDPDGNPRVASDNVWAIKHASAAKELTLTEADIDITGGRIPKTVVFTATVRLKHDSEPVKASYGYRV